MKKSLLALVAILCLTFAAQAADISGKWTVDTSAAPAGQGGGGGRGRGMAGGTYEFKVSGDTLTGSITTPGFQGGEPQVAQIADGKISGDTFSFTATRSFNGNEFKSSYTGKVVGDKIELTVDFGGRGNPRTMTLKKE